MPLSLHFLPGLPTADTDYDQADGLPLGLLGPSAAPSLGIDLLAGEESAVPGRLTRFALIQGAITTGLTCRIFWKLLDIGATGVVDIAQRDGLRVFFVQLGLRTGDDCKCRSGCCNGQEENTSGDAHRVSLEKTVKNQPASAGYLD